MKFESREICELRTLESWENWTWENIGEWRKLESGEKSERDIEGHRTSSRQRHTQDDRTKECTTENHTTHKPRAPLVYLSWHPNPPPYRRHEESVRSNREFEFCGRLKNSRVSQFVSPERSGTSLLKSLSDFQRVLALKNVSKILKFTWTFAT